MTGEIVHIQTKNIGTDVMSLNTTDLVSVVYFMKMSNVEELQIEILIKP